VGDVLAEIVAAKHGAGTVLKAPRGDPVVVGVNSQHAPALPVAHRIIDPLVHVAGVVDLDGRIVAPRHDDIAFADPLPPRSGDCRSVGVHRFLVGAAVERITHFSGVTHQQHILARHNVRAIPLQGVGGHRDRIPGVQPILAAVPLHRAPDRGRPAITQRQRRRTLGRVSYPPHLREPLRPRQIRTQLSKHPAAGLDRRQLVGIPDQHRLGLGGGGRGSLIVWVG
jgi:hypothetical protein